MQGRKGEDHDHDYDYDGVPSNPELAQRMARVEQKVDHTNQQVDRIADAIDDDLQAHTDRIDEIEPRNRRLWFAYQALKGIAVIGSGGGVLALLVQSGL